MLVRRPGSTVFLPLTGTQSIPFGSTVDATNGTVVLTTATPRRGRTQSARFYAGQFLVTQARSGLTDLKLNAALGCPAKAPDAVIARRRPNRKRRRRSLWGNGSGSFRTVGLYASGSVLGTKWLTVDTYTGTQITVAEGAVRVTDFVRHRTSVVHAPHSYLAGR